MGRRQPEEEEEEQREKREGHNDTPLWMFSHSEPLPCSGARSRGEAFTQLCVCSETEPRPSLKQALFVMQQYTVDNTVKYSCIKRRGL